MDYPKQTNEYDVILKRPYLRKETKLIHDWGTDRVYILGRPYLRETKLIHDWGTDRVYIHKDEETIEVDL